MLFNSYEFIFVFLPFTLMLFWKVIHGRSARIVMLTAASYTFYAAWDYRFCVLMFVSTAINFTSGSAIARSRSKFQRDSWFALAMFISLGLLIFFKCFDFFAVSVNAAAAAMKIDFAVPILRLILPVGLSFYTFQAISYTIDVYRGATAPCTSFWQFACFVALFPQLIAGPIVRYTEVSDQLKNIKTRLQSKDIHEGIFFFVVGLAKKILIADQIALRINPLWQNYTELGIAGSWLVALGYTYQLYFDFSGYSDMAVGLGRLLGIHFPRNFNRPYTAVNIADFWRRWHITLSNWLRDYLYISLGGSRRGILFTFRNLMITMILGGLWHGAAWTFVCWGLYYGALLSMYHGSRNLIKIHMPVTLSRVITFIAVVIGWVLFRSETLSKAQYILRAAIGLEGLKAEQWILSTTGTGILFLVAISACIAHMAPDTWDISWKPRPLLAIILGFAFSLCIFLFDHGSQFLYYQF